MNVLLTDEYRLSIIPQRRIATEEQLKPVVIHYRQKAKMKRYTVWWLSGVTFTNSHFYAKLLVFIGNLVCFLLFDAARQNYIDYYPEEYMLKIAHGYKTSVK